MSSMSKEQAREAIITSLWLVFSFLFVLFLPTALFRAVAQQYFNDPLVLNSFDYIALGMFYWAAAVIVYREYSINWVRYDASRSSVRDWTIAVVAGVGWIVWYGMVYVKYFGPSIAAQLQTVGRLLLALFSRSLLQEAVWRGLLFTSLRQAGLRFSVANTIQAFMFAGFHYLSFIYPVGWVAAIAYFAFALINGYLVERTAAIWPSVVSSALLVIGLVIF